MVSIKREHEKTPVFINGRFLGYPTTGVQRYAKEMLHAIDHELTDRDSDNAVQWGTVLIPRGFSQCPQFQNLDVKRIGYLHGNAWEQLELPYYTQNGILLNLANIAPLVCRQQLVVIHDAAVFAAPIGYSPIFKLWYRYAHRVLSRRAMMLATVSEFSRQELSSYLSVDRKRIVVIPNGSDHTLEAPLNDDFLTHHGLSRHQFILVVGSLHPNKNVGNAIRAALTLGSNAWPMVIVGASNSRVFSSTGIPVNLESKNVVFAGRVTDAELNLLYKTAGCLLFPSVYEGFGIPPLEAMRHGCPVVASDMASIPEVCGDAALYVDPRSVDAIVAALKRIQTEPDLRALLSAAGQRRAKQFLWRDSARRLISVVSRAANSLRKI